MKVKQCTVDHYRQCLWTWMGGQGLPSGDLETSPTNAAEIWRDWKSGRDVVASYGPDI